VASGLSEEQISQLAAERIRASLAVKEALLAREVLAEIASAASLVCGALRGGRKLLIFGNGGSAADAEHIAGEFVGRFVAERRALPAVALSVNTSVLTAIANDYSFEDVFARQVEALGEPGDVAFGLSTSGTSPNVVAGLRAGRERGLRTLALTGRGGGRVREHADVCVKVPADDTPRIQEGHLLVAHIVCEIAEREVVEDDSS
jgi:D-sedoheptulose 7-phosphate isomerase